MKTSLAEKKQLYDLFLNISEKLLQQTSLRSQQQQQQQQHHHFVELEDIQKLRVDIEVSWVEVEVSALKRLDDLKSTLHRWTDYTENMRDVMTWLRCCEEKIKKPFHQLDFDGLQGSLKELQVCYSFISF